MSAFSDNERIIFWSCFLFKIFLGGIFASHYLADLFIPFAKYFALEPLSNPYEFFSSNHNNINYFPYPAVMLYVISVPFIFANFFIDLNFIDERFLFLLSRIPILMADLGIFFILKSWLGNNAISKLIWLYWLSPVLIYINFVHGQLDVIPIFLLLAGLHFLFNRKLWISSAIIGLAVASKTIALLTLPFIFIYLFSKNISLHKIILYFLVIFCTAIITNLQFLFEPSFQNMVFNNLEQRKILELSFIIADRVVLIIPACLLILLIRAALIRTFNRDIFIMLLGFSFGIILVFVAPMQGWYFWLVPFLAYFYAKSEPGIRSYFLFAMLQLFYFIYFLFAPESTYSEELLWLSIAIENLPLKELLLNISYTILQTLLAINCFVIYTKGLESFTKHKISSAPFLLGIGGNSGSGKTFLSDALENIFLAENTISIKGDDVHKWQRGHKKWNEYTHLDPKANLLHREIGMLQKLKKGMKIYRSIYNHETGSFDSGKLINPKNLIIYEGLHPFYLSKQRNIYDLKVFLSPQSELAKKWKVSRDTNIRGYSEESVLRSIIKREKDSNKFIKSQRQYADIIIEANPEDASQGKQIANVNAEISYKILILNSIFIEPLLERLLNINTLKIEHNYSDDEYQEVKLHGDASAIEINKIASEMIKGLEDIGVSVSRWEDGIYGVLLLILTYIIFEDIKND